MNKYIKILILIVFAACTIFTSCNDETSYADLRDKEERIIRNFISRGITIGDTIDAAFYIHVKPINVISEAQFEAQGKTTNLERNEYVYFSGTGVYMQILREGIGELLSHRSSIICRYVEYNMSLDSVKTTNRTMEMESIPDYMSVSNSFGTISGSFISGVMYSTYGPSIPSGWLQPLHYIKLGRQSDSGKEIALVRLIVPSTQGQSDQSSRIYPCFYEISYERDR